MALPGIDEFMVKKNKPFLVIIWGAAVLLVGGTVAAYLLLGQRNFFLKDAPLGSQLVPQDAVVTASISTDAAQWQQLQKYGTPETQGDLEKQLTQMRDDLLTANGYNYEQDILPWLDKTVVIAYLASGAGATKDGIPLVQLPDIIVLPIANPTQAQRLLAKAKSLKTRQFVERTYKGVQILQTLKGNSPQVSAVVLGRFLVVTTHPKISDRVIDTYKGAASIAATPGYLQELGKIQASQPFAQVYLNLPAFSKVLATNSSRHISPEKISLSQPGQGVAATVTLEPQGIRFQGISWLKPNSTQTYEVENTSSRLPRRLPANTLLMVSGGNLAQLWQDYAQGAEFNPLAPPPANLSAGLKATLGLDWQEDLLPWMSGEFSLALVPVSPETPTLPENQPSTQLGAGVVFMVQASDRSQAETALQKLDQVMATRYGFQVATTKLGGQPVISWASPLGGISATHGWLEGNVVFLTFGAPIASAIVPQPPATLTQTSRFQQVVPTQPNPNNGQFFLDVERTINQGTLNLSQFLPTDGRIFAQAISALGVTAATSDNRSIRWDLFLQLKTSLTPSPTPETSLTPSTSPSIVIPSPQAPANTPAVGTTPPTPPQAPTRSP